MPGDFDVQEVPGLGPLGAVDATALGQRCAGSENCSRSVAEQRQSFWPALPQVICYRTGCRLSSGGY